MKTYGPFANFIKNLTDAEFRIFNFAKKFGFLISKKFCGIPQKIFRKKKFHLLVSKNIAEFRKKNSAFRLLDTASKPWVWASLSIIRKQQRSNIQVLKVKEYGKE